MRMFFSAAAALAMAAAIYIGNDTPAWLALLVTFVGIYAGIAYHGEQLSYDAPHVFQRNRLTSGAMAVLTATGAGFVYGHVVEPFSWHSSGWFSYWLLILFVGLTPAVIEGARGWQKLRERISERREPFNTI